MCVNVCVLFADLEGALTRSNYVYPCCFSFPLSLYLYFCFARFAFHSVENMLRRVRGAASRWVQIVDALVVCGVHTGYRVLRVVQELSASCHAHQAHQMVSGALVAYFLMYVT